MVSFPSRDLAIIEKAQGIFYQCERQYLRKLKKPISYWRQLGHTTTALKSYRDKGFGETSESCEWYLTTSKGL